MSGVPQSPITERETLRLDYTSAALYVIEREVHRLQASGTFGEGEAQVLMRKALNNAFDSGWDAALSQIEKWGEAVREVSRHGRRRR